MNLDEFLKKFKSEDNETLKEILLRDEDRWK